MKEIIQIYNNTEKLSICSQFDIEYDNKYNIYCLYEQNQPISILVWYTEEKNGHIIGCYGQNSDSVLLFRAAVCNMLEKDIKTILTSDDRSENAGFIKQETGGFLLDLSKYYTEQ